jgi:hypothetical protein
MLVSELDERFAAHALDRRTASRSRSLTARRRSVPASTASVPRGWRSTWLALTSDAVDLRPGRGASSSTAAGAAERQAPNHPTGLIIGPFGFPTARGRANSSRS